MKKLSAVALAAMSVATLWVARGAAVPDPRDSVIVQSKTVSSGVDHPTAVVKVYITNKDTLQAYTVCLVERSVSGGAYMTLGWPRDFDNVITPLTSTLKTVTFLATDKYNGASPDTFIVAGYLNVATEAATVEPPNAVRKALFEIKFDTVLAQAGSVSFDSARVIFPDGNIFTSFLDKNYNELAVNFKKGTINVLLSDRVSTRKWDLNYDGVFGPSDLVLLLNCVFLRKGNCGESYSPSDVAGLLNILYKEEE